MKRGQAMIEMAVILIFLTSILFSIFQFSFILGARSYLNHQLHRTLICMAHAKTLRKCKKQLIKESSRFLVWGKIKNIQIKGGEEKWRGKLTLKVHPWSIQIKQKINLEKASSQ